MAHICSVRSGVSVLQRAPFQLPRPGPSCPPDQGDQHCENAVTTKKLEFAGPPFPSLKSRAGALRGPWVHVPEPPWCRESRSCGRAACSRENCALCVAEICTVISSAVRVGRPRV